MMRLARAAFILATLGSTALADGDIEVVTTYPPGMTCWKVTFEGGVDLAPICPSTNGLIPGTPIQFAPEWQTFDLGGPDATFAYWASVSATTEILFSEPVASVEFVVGSQVNFAVTALDSNGDVIDLDSGVATGDFVPAVLQRVEATGNHIAKVLIQGNPNLTVVDNLKVCQFSDPATLIENLAVDVALLNLANGIDNSLDAKLDSALNAWDDANENNDVAACNSLWAFINAVEAQAGNKIAEDDALYLIDQALAIIDALGC